MCVTHSAQETTFSLKRDLKKTVYEKNIFFLQN